MSEANQLIEKLDLGVDALLEKVEKELVRETTNSHKHISEIDEELAKTQSKFL